MRNASSFPAVASRAPLRRAIALVSLAHALVAAPVRADEPDKDRAAEALAREAYAQHAAGSYSESIATYMKAYELSGATAILFNIAAIYDRKLHERALAIEYFRRYLQ